MFIKNKYLILMFIFSTMLFGNMIGSLANKYIQISGVFFKSSKSVYLTSLSGENNFSIWKYSNERKYSPIHNTHSFDGYDGAKKIFNDISLSGNSVRVRGINENNYIEFKQKEYALNKTKAISMRWKLIQQLERYVLKEIINNNLEAIKV